jgi:molybdenum cofactor biosynthesis enzyme MoaA
MIFVTSKLGILRTKAAQQVSASLLQRSMLLPPVSTLLAADSVQNSRSPHSTSSAVLEDNRTNHDVAEEVSSSSSSSMMVHPVTSSSSSSRLHALRVHLHSSSSNSTTANLSFSQAKKKKPHPLQQPATSPIPTQTPAQLRHLIDSLPPVPPDRTALYDTHQRHHDYLRISLTEKCQLRCTYCMPAAGIPNLTPPSDLLTTSELLQLATYFRAAGVRKFRLTGGEPTLRRDLVTVLQGLHELRPDSIGMTTNGVTLQHQLPALVRAGLTHVNISLDTLSPTLFQTLTRRPAATFYAVWESIQRAIQINTSDTDTDDYVDDESDTADSGVGHDRRKKKKNHLQVKLNCVVQRGVNDHEVADFCRLTEQFPSLQVRFIEYMPFQQNGWHSDKLVPYTELVERVNNSSSHHHHHDDPDKNGLYLQPIPSRDPHDTTKWYTTPTHARVGFITSMSNHFCASCNRLRLTADGQLRVCLFDGNTMVSLRDVLRFLGPVVAAAAAADDDDTSRSPNGDLDKLVYYALSKKHWKLGGHSDPQDIMQDAANNRPMTVIGG